MIEKAKDSILVCISDAKSNSLVIKKANEIASKENARLIALYICDRNDYQKKQEKGFLQQNLDLAESIGAMIEIIYDDDIAAQIVNFAKLYRVKKIVLGRNNNQRNFFILTNCQIKCNTYGKKPKSSSLGVLYCIHFLGLLFIKLKL